jgi:beta-glucanase (GH16 family)
MEPSILVRVFLLTLALTASGYGQSASSGRPDGKSSWTLTWSDEFNGPDGSLPEARKWSLEAGGNGWGNQELEYYTRRPENVHIENGHLVIIARREDYTGKDGIRRHFTSARIRSQGKFSQAYGRFEARIRLPYGQGLWPAFWMLGDDIDQAGWPECGEIDIMENIGKEPSTVHGTIHGPGYSGDNGIGAPFTLSSARFSDNYHLFVVEWSPNVIRFYVDKHLYATRTPEELPRGTSWVYNHPFFLILNVAVGGSWPGSPDSSTSFPQEMLVDYVRVYRRSTP